MTYRPAANFPGGMRGIDALDKICAPHAGPGNCFEDFPAFGGGQRLQVFQGGSAAPGPIFPGADRAPASRLDDGRSRFPPVPLGA